MSDSDIIAAPDHAQPSPDADGVSRPFPAAAIMVLATLLRRSAAMLYTPELDLGRHEWQVMAVFQTCDAISLRELSERLGYDKGLMSREVSALVARGLLVKERPNRNVRIQPSTAGAQIVERLRALSTARNDILFQDLTAQEREVFTRQLDLIANRAKAFLEPEG